MKLSICIPQYNRISFLKKNLEIIERQSYKNIEVVVSDDCSTDNTCQEIDRLIPVYKFPLVYYRFEKNQGYDTNLRKSIELATGDYVIVIGNDDTINPEYDLEQLEIFLQKNNLPEIGFTNFKEDKGQLFERAKETTVLGSGKEVALKYYSCFSFVGGIIFRKDCFEKYNTSKYDGSIYSQIYLACYVVALNKRLFSIREPVVIKDIVLDDVARDTYRDKINRKWKNYKKVDGGLPSVIHVLMAAMTDAGVFTKKIAYRIFRKIYSTTLPYWIIDYRSCGAYPEAVGLAHGMYPRSNQDFSRLGFFGKTKIMLIYITASFGALLFPVFIFKKMKTALYNYFKK